MDAEEQGAKGVGRGWGSGGVADCISSAVNHVSGVASRHSSDVSQLQQLSGSACVCVFSSDVHLLTATSPAA